MLPDLKLELDQLTALGKRREFVASRRLPGALIEMRGKKLVDFTNWDSLALSFDKKLKRVAQNFVEQNELGVCAARLSGGTSAQHLITENRLAAFLGYESALLFSSKNQAVLSLVSALCNEQDVILHDELIQSAVADAAYLVNTRAAPFSSKDLGTLERELESAKSARRRFIFVESISPITGNSPDFIRLLAIAKKSDSQLIIDESFALGSAGLRGAGSSEQAHVSPAVSAVFCDLSLAANSYGAFVSGSKILCDYLTSRSKTFTLEGAMPPTLAALICGAIDAIELKNAARQKIWTSAEKLSRGLFEIFAAISTRAQSAIVCQPFEKTSLATSLVDALFQRGFLAEAVATGAARSDAAVVRYIVSSHHTDEQIDNLLNAIAEIAPRLVR